jgi:N-acetylglucosaminyldiphosphoundecaprenol N-acetyl-beta-D-mannosaminyltransferase
VQQGSVDMRDLGKRNVLGVLVDAVDRESAVARVLDAAREGRPYGVTALAVHGVMTGVDDDEHRYRLNHLDLVTPDGQPVRWAINLLHGAGLTERVYGPDLMRDVCRAAAGADLPIYLYGTTDETLKRLRIALEVSYPGIMVAGSSPSRFGRTTPDEKEEITRRIVGSGARIAFVGLGCPRQEVFAYEYRDELRMPVIAVGAAFDYLAGTLREPPAWVQRWGLQWLWRLVQDPVRLWERYTVLNARYVSRLMLQRLGLDRPDPAGGTPPSRELLHG